MTFAVAGIGAMAVTEILRGKIRHIGLWGTVVTGICAAGTVVCGIGWLVTR